MAKGIIKAKLGRQYRLLLTISVIILPLLTWAGVVAFLRLAELKTGSRDDLAVGPLLGLALCVGWYVLTGYAVWYLIDLENHHPNLQALSRYGPVRELLTEIEAELASPTRTIKVGEVRSFELSELVGELGATEVWLTPSWMIWFLLKKRRMHFFRLHNVVAAFREGRAVVVIDDKDSRVRIPGREMAVVRLLAEILVCVPWTLKHFDEQTEQSWKENRTNIIAQVSQRRREIQQKKASN
jgi:hypothetical protein